MISSPILGWTLGTLYHNNTPEKGGNAGTGFNGQSSSSLIKSDISQQLKNSNTEQPTNQQSPNFNYSSSTH